MMRTLRIGAPLYCLTLLALGASGAWAATDSAASDGKALLEKNCSRCHAIEATGVSPLPQAPALR